MFLTSNVGFDLRNLQIAAFCILMSHFMESMLKKRSINSCECCDNWNSWSFGGPVLYHPKWIQSDLLKPVTLLLSSHTIQSVNNNPWRHWKDLQTSQVNKCPDIFRRCPTGTKTPHWIKNPRKVHNPFGTTPYSCLSTLHAAVCCSAGFFFLIVIVFLTAAEQTDESIQGICSHVPLPFGNYVSDDQGWGCSSVG